MKSLLWFKSHSLEFERQADMQKLYNLKTFDSKTECPSLNIWAIMSQRTVDCWNPRQTDWQMVTNRKTDNLKKFKFLKLSHISNQNITTQSVVSPCTPHLSMMTIVIFTFELWPPKSIGFTMVNMSDKFDEEAHNGLVCIRFTAYFHMCPLWPWLLISDLKNQ